MKDHVKYSTARNQLYGVKVAFRELLEKMPKHHRTPQLLQLLETLDSVIQQSCDAFEGGNITEVLINVYVPTPLPGFEEYVTKAREAAKKGLPLTSDEQAAIDLAQEEFLQHLSHVARWMDAKEGGTDLSPEADWNTDASTSPDGDGM